MRSFVSTFLLILFLLHDTPLAAAANRHLIKIDERILNGGSHDLDFDGTNWYVARGLSGSLSRYDESFTFLGPTSIPGIGDMRGLAYSSTRNQLVISDQNTGIIRFVTSNGNVVNQFATGINDTEGLDVDDRDSTIWITRFSGMIQQWSFQGELLFSFNATGVLPTNDQLQSVAVDPATNGLFVFTDDDDVFEFSMSGALRGQLLTDPFPESLPSILDNGLGIHYDPIGKILRVTSQGGGLIAYQLVPEPICSGLLAAGALFWSFVRPLPIKRNALAKRHNN